MSVAPTNAEFIAYQIGPPDHMPLRPAPIFRDWMDATALTFAYRCLPLALANQCGWTIACPCSFSIRWNGGDSADSLFLVFDETPDDMVSSLFGYGIVTFNMPCLFRTPSGVNLWVKGPSNYPKDGVCPLEGLVETDWSSSTFTMNWKLTRAEHLVRFERGEPICMVIPVSRGLLESLDPVTMPIASSPEVNDAFRAWSKGRDSFHERIATGEPAAISVGWQKDYFQGRDPGTELFADHQTRLAIKPFREAESQIDPEGEQP